MLWLSEVSAAKLWSVICRRSVYGLAEGLQEYLDQKCNFKFEKRVNYFDRLIQKSNVFEGKSLVGQVVVGEMSQITFKHSLMVQLVSVRDPDNCLSDQLFCQ